uniref:Uncharacterized protein n=1 Tax=Ditylenchus dipsaci TaxID=166011 RepID=A0A915EJ88_9BILA
MSSTPFRVEHIFFHWKSTELPVVHHQLPVEVHEITTGSRWESIVLPFQVGNWVDCCSSLTTADGKSSWSPVLSPLIQLKLHCENLRDPLVFELTPQEAKALLTQLSST